MEEKPMKYDEKTVSSEEIFKGRVIRVRRDTVQLCNGKNSTREVVEHPGGVAIVAKTPQGKVILVNQFRKPFDKQIWEIPAGKLEYGEDHRDCGIRELEEEAGYTAEVFEYLGNFYVSPGFCNEKINIYFADKLTKTHTHPDEDEFLDIAEMDFKTVLDMVKNNEIHDGKTVIGVLMTKEKFGF